VLNWVITPYEQLEDLSMTTTHILAQVFAASIGMFAFMAICYGLFKLFTREK